MTVHTAPHITWTSAYVCTAYIMPYTAHVCAPYPYMYVHLGTLHVRLHVYTAHTAYHMYTVLHMHVDTRPGAPCRLHTLFAQRRFPPRSRPPCEDRGHPCAGGRPSPGCWLFEGLSGNQTHFLSLPCQGTWAWWVSEYVVLAGLVLLCRDTREWALYGGSRFAPSSGGSAARCWHQCQWRASWWWHHTAGAHERETGERPGPLRSELTQSRENYLNPFQGCAPTLQVPARCCCYTGHPASSP